MKKLLIRLSVVAGILVVLFIVISFILATITNRSVTNLRNEIIKSGDYLDIEDYPLMQVSDQENAYKLLLEIEDQLNAFEKQILDAKLDVAFDTDEWNSLPAQDLEKITELINGNTELFADLYRVSECQGFRSEFEPTDGFAAALPHLTQIRSVCRAFSIKAFVDASQGKGDEAIDSSLAILRIGRFANSEPLLITYLVSIACESLSLGTTHQVCEISEVSANKIDQYLEALNEIDTYQSVIDAIKGERSMAVMTFEQIRSGTLNTDLDSQVSGVTKLSGYWFTDAYLNDDEAAYLTIISKQLAVLREPKEIRDRAINEAINSLQKSNLRFILTKLILPALGNVVDASDRLEAQIRCLRLSLIARRTNAAGLDSIEVDPELKLDPFTQKPLISRSLQDQLLIYSVGPNLIDDQGAIVSTEENPRPLDIGFGPSTVRASKLENQSNEDPAN
ncbi:MAG: hypothetical protein L7U72_00905 [Rubripirellula sp.]|nr:hypothetical protein [Rubripirellula sp.]